MVGNTTLPTVAAALFTTSAGATDVVRGAVLAAVTNCTAALYKLPSGITATSNSTVILPTVSLGANTTYVVKELLNQVFAQGDSLWGVASVSGAVAVNIGGGRVT